MTIMNHTVLIARQAIELRPKVPSEKTEGAYPRHEAKGIHPWLPVSSAVATRPSPKRDKISVWGPRGDAYKCSRAILTYYCSIISDSSWVDYSLLVEHVETGGDRRRRRVQAQRRNHGVAL